MTRVSLSTDPAHVKLLVMPKAWFQISLLNFFLAASLGALMRFAFVEEVSWMDYRNVMHGHSHVAMLGWVYMAIYGLLVSVVLQPDETRKKYYSRLFWVTQLSVLGMLIAFPLFGYTAVSIVFSSLHIICSYFFVITFWKDFRPVKKRWSTVFIKTSLVFMVLSTLAIWCLVPVMVSDMKGSAVYYALIQFFLHFQFNGWFIFSLLGLLFWFLEQESAVSMQLVKPFYRFLLVATILTYVLAVTWSTPLALLFYVNSLGVLMQLIALYYFLSWLNKNSETLRSYFNGPSAILFFIAVAAFILKILAQSVLVVPAVAEIAYTIRNFVIGFLHLLLLGMVTTFLLAFARKCNKFQVNYVYKAGLVFLILGIIGSELLLFVQGTMFWLAMGFMPYYYEMLFIISLCIPLGILLLITTSFRPHLAS